MTVVNTAPLKNIAEIEFADIVEDVHEPDINELRIFLYDGSFIDVWFSLKIASRYSYHWERRKLDSTIYRHDNMPDRKWNRLTTFPKHFHDGSEQNVIESKISDNPEVALREFLTFVRSKVST